MTSTPQQSGSRPADELSTIHPFESDDEHEAFLAGLDGFRGSAIS